MNKSYRKGFGIMCIIGIISIIAVLTAFILPKLGNARLPAIESNLKQDIATIKQATDIYYLSNNGSYIGLTMSKLIDKGYIKGAFAENVMSSASNNKYIKGTPVAIDDYYAPNYSSNEKSIKISIITTLDGEEVNIFINASNDPLKFIIEDNMYSHFSKFGPGYGVNGNATTISQEPIVTDSPSNRDGILLATLEG